MTDPTQKPIHRIVNLIAPETQQLLGTDAETARDLLLRHGASGAQELNGSFALVARDQENVLLARSLDRPMRYFLAKEEAGPFLIVAERIDEIQQHLMETGFVDQFHPSYTRMVPAHHVTRLRLVGCPDPNPRYERFCALPAETLAADLDTIGDAYVGALLDGVSGWLERQNTDEPIGVLFSGGIDSGAVLLAAHQLLLRSGQTAARLKAFTLTVDGQGADAVQAREFLQRTELEFLWEPIDVPHDALDPFRAIELIEDYKPLDVECATVNLALLEAIRNRYTDWRLLLDGDGGDENLKDYPIEANSELTIRSVVNNPMLYQEGWGVDCIKHSLTYSGGLSRGCVRTYAPARQLGFRGFSPHMQPQVVAASGRIPFDELSSGSEERLYELKGEIVRRGLERLLGVSMPVYPKRRFQHGATSDETFSAILQHNPELYRTHYLGLHRQSPH